MNVFPNPVYDVLNIGIELNRGQDVEIAILNAVGQQVYENHFPNYRTGIERIDVSALATGVYVVKVQVASGTYSVRVMKW